MLGSDSKGSSGSQDSSGRQRRQTTKPLVKQPSDNNSGGGGGGGGGSITGARQDTGYSTESSDSRRSRTRKVNTHTVLSSPVPPSEEILQNPFLSGVKSYSTSTGCELRELEDLSEIPSDYRELGEISDSESEMRGSVVSGTDLTSYSAMNLSDFQVRVEHCRGPRFRWRIMMLLTAYWAIETQLKGKEGRGSGAFLAFCCVFMAKGCL